MATTGFWPVKNRLKEVINYAPNPHKTITKKFLDKNLYAALGYVEDDKKQIKQYFNEWYAAQTSKKIRAVWQSKADNGKCVSSSVPSGYKRS